MPRGKPPKGVDPIILDIMRNPRDDKERYISEKLSRMSWKEIKECHVLALQQQMAIHELIEGKTPQVMPIDLVRLIAMNKSGKIGQ